MSAFGKDATRYDADADRHPVYAALQQLGELVLVGSRVVYGLATPESDWDYYLVIPRADEGATIKRLENLGFRRLPGEGGPYGFDHAIYGIWRLPEVSMFGRQWPHVDVILCPEDVFHVRKGILLALRQKNTSIIGRALKAEKGWGKFWWLVDIPLRAAAIQAATKERE